jgi:hypothetical protein
MCAFARKKDSGFKSFSRLDLLSEITVISFTSMRMARLVLSLSTPGDKRNPDRNESKEAIMSQILTKTKRPHFLIHVPTRSRRSPEKLLREAAFILEMTRRVKEAILGKKLLPVMVEC